MIKQMALALALTWSVPALADTSATGDAAAAAPHDDLLYAALCRGILWPDDRPTLLAAETLPADTALELRVRAGLDAAAAADPTLAHAFAAEAADGTVWLDRTLADDDQTLADGVRAECRVHLEILAPTLQGPTS